MDKLQVGWGVAGSHFVLDWRTLDWPRRQVVKRCPSGSYRRAWEPFGMPRINEQFLDAIVYLYPTFEAAEAGDPSGGTGFLVCAPFTSVPDVGCIYAVSNKHVVLRDGCSVIRVNRFDGGVTIFPLEPHEWTAHPDGDDLAIALININTDTEKIALIPLEWFVTKEKFNDELGIGDEVLMTGRFISHDGKKRNVPSARFGNLSIPLMGMRQPSGYVQESFGVEMRSMSGYSGSPVFIFLTPYDLRRNVTMIGSFPIYFLGIDWGHITETKELIELIPAIVENSTGKETRKSTPHYTINTGMTGVVPAWKLIELLYSQSVVNVRSKIEYEFASGPNNQVKAVFDAKTVTNDFHLPSDERASFLTRQNPLWEPPKGS